MNIYLHAARIFPCLCLLVEGVYACMQTAAPSEVIAAAKSLPQQEVDKPKVWLLLAGGSAVLFGVTVFLEKQTQLFPAISKANQAMSQSRTARQVGRSARPGTVHSLPIAPSLLSIELLHPDQPQRSGHLYAGRAAPTQNRSRQRGIGWSSRGRGRANSSSGRTQNRWLSTRCSQVCSLPASAS